MLRNMFEHINETFATNHILNTNSVLYRVSYISKFQLDAKFGHCTKTYEYDK